MENFAKRYFWVVNLVILCILAYLGARVINNVLAGRIAALETHRAEPEEVDRARIVAASAAGRTQEWADLIAEINLFNSDPPELESFEGSDSTEEGEGAGTPEGGVPGPNDECKKAEGSLTLLATMVAEPREWSMAIVQEKSESRLVKETQRLSEGASVVAIYRARMVLSSRGGYECADLGQRGGRRISKSSTMSLGKPRSGGTRGSDAIAKGIKKDGKNHYKVDQGMLNEQLEDLHALSRQARVIPHYRDGKPQGFKLVGVRPGSLYSHLGIRSGDVIKGINGEEITSPNKALQLYEKLKNSNNVVLDLQRRGRKVTLEYDIE